MEKTKDADYKAVFSRGWDAGERSHERPDPPLCPFDMLLSRSLKTSLAANAHPSEESEQALPCAKFMVSLMGFSLCLIACCPSTSAFPILLREWMG